ncbi:MAG: hypothetical protein SFY96_02255 [Planctomycetota bacterium]|nr:hypothetical protein [Planctomycetota bacterium]
MRSVMFFSAAVLASVSVAQGATLYSQANNLSTSAGLFSDAVAGQFFSQRMADNFTLAGGGQLTGVRWYGGSQWFQFPDLTNMSGFTVEILADDAGAPDGTQVIYSQAFTKAATNPTLNGNLMNFGHGQYTFEVSLANAVNLNAGTQYWISIGATLVNPFADGWVWSKSTQGDGTNASNFFNGPNYFTFNSGDMAFDLVGNIPTPGSVGVMALAGLVAARRRR